MTFDQLAAYGVTSCYGALDFQNENIGRIIGGEIVLNPRGLALVEGFKRTEKAAAEAPAAAAKKAAAKKAARREDEVPPEAPVQPPPADPTSDLDDLLGT